MALAAARSRPLSKSAAAILAKVDDLEVTMSENMKSNCVSRREVFRVFGLAALASSLAIPATVLTVTDAEARVGNPASAVSVAGANRRDRRQDRRYKKKKQKKN
jgi:hypothetical protein